MLTIALTAVAQTTRQLKVYQKTGMVDVVRMNANGSIRHSCTDLNGQVHQDYVTMVVTDAEGHERQYLLTQLDSLVLPSGQRVVFNGSMLSQPLYAPRSTEWTDYPRSAPRRTSFGGSFPGKGTGNVTFYWTENDHIRLDVGDESRAVNLTNNNTSAEFVFEDSEFESPSYMVYYPDRSVTIPSVQMQTGADNTEHIGRSGDCGSATATRNDADGSYSFTLTHKAAYLCFLPHIDHLPSARIEKITLNCSSAIAGTYLLSESGLYNATRTSNTITLHLTPQKQKDFFIGHDVSSEQDTCAAYMVIAPQGSQQTFTATYYITDTLSHIEKIYRQTFSFQPVANTVYPVTCHILDEEFRTIDLGLSCNWSNVNVGALEPSETGNTYATDAEANAALLEQTVVTEWLMPDEDQIQEILEKCQWTRGMFNGVNGYFVEGAVASLGDGIVHRIFIPCAEDKTREQCLEENFRPVEALMVDLGLPSGTKWAARNIGAISVEDYGHYYAWGEVETKDSYTSGNYKYGTQSLGNNFDISGTQNDAAVVNWGGLWRMPTKDEMIELRNESSWLWSSINGVNGYTVTGNNGNKIFLPAAGIMDGTSTIKPNSGGSYLSSTLAGDRSNNVWVLFWQKNRNAEIYVSASEVDYWLFESHDRPYKRYYGETVRPVSSPSAIGKDGNSYNIVTDSAVWKLCDPEVTLCGTLSSSLPIKGNVTVGFVVGDSAKIVKGKSRFEFSKETNIGGAFSQSLPVHDNIGYWYRAYLEVGDTIYYGDARHYGYELINLGLPSGTLWANMNVGASQPMDFGNYYAWGEVETKDSYTKGNYKYGTLNIGVDFDIAGTEYDAAHVNMGGAWRMPTKNQFDELLENCETPKWTSQDGVTGYQLISKINGNSIFFPAAGMMDGTSKIKPVSGGCYFSSTLGGDRSNNVWTLYWQKDRSSDIHIKASEVDYWLFESHDRPYKRYYGGSIRAVFMSNAVTATNNLNIRTDSATWKLNDSEAVLYGTLSSTLPLEDGTQVGFVVGGNSSVDKATAVKVFTSLKTTTGSFHETVGGIENNMGYWFRAYVEYPSGEVFYGEPKHFGWEMVDLGLPSGTLWANVNVGATRPEDYGNYYAWGEVYPKDSYTSSNYLYGTQNLGENLNIAATEYDAAFFTMNHSWCMPTDVQMKELLENCTPQWTGQDGVNGYRLTSKINGNSIFLPAGGMMDGTSKIKPVSGGCYFSSTLGGDRSNNVWTLYWQKDRSSDIHIKASEVDYWLFESHERPYKRYYGSNIRPVAVKGTVMVGDVVVHITTEAPEWTPGQTTAIIKGMISSSEPLSSDVTVGFLVTNHYYADRATVKTYHDIEVSAAGEFSLVQDITSVEGLYYTAYIKMGGKYYYGRTRHAGQREMVNLGLPSGKLWANVNLGAATEDDPGDYFAWGETATKQSFTSDNYLLKTDGNYTELGSDISGTQYDAARVLWHGAWRMPTESEMNELINNCDWSYVTVNGHPCYKAKSRLSDAYVLFPEGGICLGSSKSNDNYWAFYWTSNNSGTTDARRTNFYGQGSRNMYSENRANGLLIKAIMDR